MAYDIVIKSGTIFDGEGAQPITADIGISKDKITKIGEVNDSGALKVINAEGKYVTPGFVDITNHSDTHLTLFKYPHLESMVMQGITTIIGGNCGASLTPMSGEAITGIQKWADPSEINVNWNTTDEFLGEIARIGVGVNFGTFIGYGSLRRLILGNDIRVFNPTELAQARMLLQEGVKQGAFGLSLGLAYGHERVSTTEEITSVANILQETGGTVKMHLRSEGSGLFAAVNEAVQIGRELNIPIEISHMKAIGKKSWPVFQNILELLQDAQKSNNNIHFDTTAYNTTGSSLYLLLPSWSRDGGIKALLERAKDPVQKPQILTALAEMTLHYDEILITSAHTKSAVGKTIGNIAVETGLTNEEALLQTVVANEGRVTIIGTTVSEENTTLAVKNENSFIASDGFGLNIEAKDSGNLSHPRSFGNFPRFWNRYIVNQKLMAAEVAIQKMTSGPAKKIGLKNRGVLKEDAFADITIFNPKEFRDTATEENPYQYPIGLEAVIINGGVVVDQGQHQKTKAGIVLRYEP